jgi:hypothetical protein
MLVTGIVPWEGSNRKEIEASITKESSNPEGLVGLLMWFYQSMKVPTECADFILGLLDANVVTRNTADSARVRPSHPWQPSVAQTVCILSFPPLTTSHPVSHLPNVLARAIAEAATRACSKRCCGWKLQLSGSLTLYTLP